jgi:hypothetical protein
VCSERYDVGTPLFLIATPARGSSFAGWSGVDCAPGTTPNVCFTALHSPVAAVATFTADPPPAPASHAPAPGTGTITPPPPPDTTAPRISGAKIDKRRVVRFKVSEPASTTARVMRGRKLVAKVTGSGTSLKIGKRLKRGRYRVVLIATDKAGNASKPVALTLRVL